MKRVFACAAFAGALMLTPGILGANGSPCSLEGTWYGFNSAGNDVVMTIARTGAKSYSAFVVIPAGSAHGEFVRQPGGDFETTWMGYSEGPNFGYPPGTMVMYYMYGDAAMDGCDRWTATTDWDVYLFNEGLQEDPFEDGVYQFTLPGIELIYKRMPMVFPAP